jgi:cell division septum initiation protein DivIVA
VAQVMKANERLREKNDALQNEVEELKEMVEISKAHGRPGSSGEVVKSEDAVGQ